MKNTYIMLAVVGTFMLIWVCLACVTYCFSNILTFKDAMSHGAVGFFMVVFGWIPSAVVGYDINRKLED